MQLEVLSVTASPLPLLLNKALYPAAASLVSLTLARLPCAHMPPGTLARFLRLVRLPALQHLALEALKGPLWTEFVVDALRAQGPGQTPAFPALRDLVLAGLGDAGADADASALHGVQTVEYIRLDGVEPQPLSCAARVPMAMFAARHYQRIQDIYISWRQKEATAGSFLGGSSWLCPWPSREGGLRITTGAVVLRPCRGYEAQVIARCRLPHSPAGVTSGTMPSLRNAEKDAGDLDALFKHKIL
ncbi:hypothetical protein GGX14DRAFT_658033 [Mycena pura]|uniref:Uncharacterized protein n=1 Tax=Mycena pura TaxID=153505 RepID=A0AAD6YM45_9AGAR|nr:hypothetical protein GGX14DRAFT_658033 [Mycena pura]